MAGDLFETIGGTAGCRKLAEVFYARVKHDAVLRPFFPGKSMRCAIEAFSAFLVQFLGGPPEDTAHRWWVSLRESHLRFRIGAREREAWLRLMTEALAEARIAEPARGALAGFFERSSAYLVNQDTVAADGESRLDAEIGRRWERQRRLDEAVAAVRRGDAGGAIALAESAGCGRPVFAQLLALMIGHGGGAMLDRVEEQLRADPALAAVRYYGRTLLHAAAGAGQLRIVEVLLGLGADAGTVDGGGHTPLYALGNECLQGGEDVVRALVRAGADVNAAGVERSTPLHMAARRGNVEVAAALVECGAKIDARDRKGVTPLGRALNCRKAEVAALLRSRGGT